MEKKYPHWYQCKPEECMEEEPCMYPKQSKVKLCHDEYLKDRLLCLIGMKVLVSVCAPVTRKCRTTFCGTLCYIGCDFIIVNVCVCKKPLSLHIPMSAIRFIAPV